MVLPSAVSLYSGCGGLDLGLEAAGFEIVAAVEKDTDCCASLRLNRVAPVIFEQDITAVSSDELLASVALKPGQVDLVAGGPPCPPYSKSRFYRKDKPRALHDPNSITLTEYLRVLEDLRPKLFLMENVPGLAYDVHSDALELVLATAHALGYRTQYRVINAADYGVPQMRERLFIVGNMPDIPFTFPSPTHGKPGGQQTLFERTKPWVTAGEVLDDLDTAEKEDDTGHFAGGQHHNLLVQVPPGDNYLFFTEKRGHPEPVFKWRSRYWSFLLKLSPDKPSWTIQARRSNNMGPFHWRNRILRIEEVKRLQTFPDSWKLHGRVDSQWRQLGNAVPPRLATALGNSLVSALTNARELEKTAS